MPRTCCRRLDEAHSYNDYRHHKTVITSLYGALSAFARRAAVRRAAIDRYFLPAGPTAANRSSGYTVVGPYARTDRQTDARQMHRPCSVYYAGGANK